MVNNYMLELLVNLRDEKFEGEKKQMSLEFLRELVDFSFEVFTKSVA
jgi:hypothetical protein